MNVLICTPTTKKIYVVFDYASYTDDNHQYVTCDGIYSVEVDKEDNSIVFMIKDGFYGYPVVMCELPDGDDLTPEICYAVQKYLIH